MFGPDREVSVATISIVPLVLEVLSEIFEVPLSVVVLVGEPSVSVAVIVELPYGANIVAEFVDMAVPVTVIGTTSVRDIADERPVSDKMVELLLIVAEICGDTSLTDVVGAIVVSGSTDSIV